MGLWQTPEQQRRWASEDFNLEAGPLIERAVQGAKDAFQTAVESPQRALSAFSVPSLESLTSGWSRQGTVAPADAPGGQQGSPLSAFSVPSLESLTSGWGRPTEPTAPAAQPAPSSVISSSWLRSPPSSSGPGAGGFVPPPGIGAGLAPAPSTPSAPVPSGPGVAASSGGLPDVAIDRSSPDHFLASFLPAARSALEAKGLPTSLAPILAAIPMNEQGWQKAAPGNNYYGIKGSNPRTGANTGPVGTWEDYGGGRVNIQDTFRAYDSPAESVADFIQFLQDNPRYGNALKVASGGDPAAFIRAVHAAGYATDPAWSDKVLSIAGRATAAAAKLPEIAGGALAAAARPVAAGLTGAAPSSPASAPPAGVPTAVADGPGWRQTWGKDLTPNQINETLNLGLSWDAALATCGIAASVAFARAVGRPPTFKEALELAQRTGEWNQDVGMTRGTTGQIALLKGLGVDAEARPLNEQEIATTVLAGSPVQINAHGNGGHFYVAQGYDPQTRQFDFGNSAAILKRSGGKTWFRLDELPGLGVGSPSEAIYLRPASSR